MLGVEIEDLDHRRRRVQAEDHASHIFDPDPPTTIDLYLDIGAQPIDLWLLSHSSVSIGHCVRKKLFAVALSAAVSW